MLNKKLMMLTIVIISLLAVTAVSAADNATDDIVGVESNDDVIAAEKTDDVNLELNDDSDNEKALSTNPKTFTALNETINNNNARDVYLDCNYTFELGSDDAFKEGVVINRAVTVHGNGYTLDGNNAARIFTVTNYNVVFKDIVFVNGNATGYGGAIFGIRAEFTAINCTFNNNSAQMSDGAVSYGSAVNCTFNSNTAIFSVVLWAMVLL